MNLKRPLVESENDDPFKDMGFIKFWIVSTLFCIAFPVSLFVSCFVIGRIQTKKLVKAIAKDFLQTALILIAVVGVIIWVIYQYLSGLF
jgi:TRAP-type C4-dicarboxylate transport system permease large subunit